MAQKITGYVKLQIPAGKATPAPPVGPALGQHGVNIKPKAVECVGEIPSPVNVPTGCSFHTRCPYKCERCTKEDPVMREVEPGHTVRCHLIDK